MYWSRLLSTILSSKKTKMAKYPRLPFKAGLFNSDESVKNMQGHYSKTQQCFTRNCWRPAGSYSKEVDGELKYLCALCAIDDAMGIE